MIYILEDDGSIRNFVEYALNGQGLETRGFERPSDFWRELDRCVPSLLLRKIFQENLAISPSRSLQQQ